MFCYITKDALNVMKIVIIKALPKLQLLPFCFVGQYSIWKEKLIILSRIVTRVMFGANLAKKYVFPSNLAQEIIISSHEN